MRNLLRIYLKKQGFEVKEATNGSEAVAFANNEPFDVIILDVMMPDMDGWQVCRKIRERHQTPIIMLTARNETKDKVQGLGVGADDYVTKPFEPEELIARIHALLRRANPNQTHVSAQEMVEFPEGTIYPEGRQVLIRENSVELTPKEFDLFLMLARYRQKAFARDALVEALWGFDYAGDTRVIDTHVKNIREKLQRSGLSYNPIQTVWGVGYKFHVPEDRG
ncbi:response regulator transcription factor [Paenibacillus antri]|uniref:Response regulator transcription factor n=2 Tax=Paenibacillus antri TaxID=2582848 RepID=A0A5R9G1B4_9BACL|nr:response regulator transcription factor [Paenibacillus antri]